MEARNVKIIALSVWAVLASGLVALPGSHPAPRSDDRGVALNSPECLKAPDAKNEQAGDEVLGVSRNGEHCAYPLRMMAYHRVVNDHLGGPPILVAYDPNSAAGAAYDPVVSGRTLNFDAAPTKGGIPTLRDRETGSVWSLITGEALEGGLQGTKLPRLTSLIQTWQRWKALHSAMWVLKETPALTAHYLARDTPATFALPGGDLPAKPDRRLSADTIVLGVVSGGAARAYIVSQLQKGTGVVTDTLGGRRIVVLWDPAGKVAAAYEVVGTEQNHGQTFRARDTGAARVFFVQSPYGAWNIEGEPNGPHPTGIRPVLSLRPISFIRSRWYAWSASHPATGIAQVLSAKAASRPDSTKFRGALVPAAGFDGKQARRLIVDGYNSVAFDLSSGGAAASGAARLARAAGLRVFGWIQVGRDEEAARRHPEWMHTPQHTEWLQTTDHSVDRAVDSQEFAPSSAATIGGGIGSLRTPASPQARRAAHAGSTPPVSAPPGSASGDVHHSHAEARVAATGQATPDAAPDNRLAIYPWVCVNNRAVFDYEAARVSRILASSPRLDGLFLCDIQGPPMGCGCGNPLCRSWDNSPGEKIAPAPYKHPDVYFSKVFVDAVERAHPDLTVIPVLCEECENGIDVGPAANPDLTGPCHEIPCAHPCSLDYYPGLLRALSGSRPIGLLSFYRLFRRSGSEYGAEASWIAHILRRVHQSAPTQPVIAVLQGWSGSRAQRAIQNQRALEGGAGGYLMAMTYVKQSWWAVRATQ